MHPRLARVAIAACTVALATGAAVAGGKNLKYFPKDADLQEEMKRIKKSLGVECSHCHIVVPKKQFEADTERKLAALGMLRMCDKLSQDLFRWKDAPKATCFMCHKGKHRPELKPDAADAEDKFKSGCRKPDKVELTKSMEKMVERMNQELDVFKKKDGPKATCWMCHRGQEEPRMKVPED